MSKHLVDVKDHGVCEWFVKSGKTKAFRMLVRMLVQMLVRMLVGQRWTLRKVYYQATSTKPFPTPTISIATTTNQNELRKRTNENNPPTSSSPSSNQLGPISNNAMILVFNYQHMLDPKVAKIISKKLESESIIVFDEAVYVLKNCQ